VQIGKRLQNIHSSSQSGMPDWREIEACLFAIKSVSNYIPQDER